VKSLKPFGIENVELLLNGDTLAERLLAPLLYGTY
jgi:hypothetical protein